MFSIWNDTNRDHRWARSLLHTLLAVNYCHKWSNWFIHLRIDFHRGPLHFLWRRLYFFFEFVAKRKCVCATIKGSWGEDAASRQAALIAFGHTTSRSDRGGWAGGLRPVYVRKTVFYGIFRKSHGCALPRFNRRRVLCKTANCKLTWNENPYQNIPPLHVRWLHHFPERIMWRSCNFISTGFVSRHEWSCQTRFIWRRFQSCPYFSVITARNYFYFFNDESRYIFCLLGFEYEDLGLICWK